MKELYARVLNLDTAIQECSWIYGYGLTGRHGAGKVFKDGRYSCTECRPRSVILTTLSDLDWIRPTDVVVLS